MQRTRPLHWLALWLAVALGPAHAANFEDPGRQYVRVQGSFDIQVERSLQDGDPKLAEAATRKLVATLAESIGALPPHARQEMRNLRYFLLWGVRSPLGGEDNGMRYVRPGEARPGRNRDPRWEHGIVIYSADNLMYLSPLWSKKALVHEMGHAWHLARWPEKHPPIVQAWENAVAKGLYRNVTNAKGQTIASAYAEKNQLEYFAELTAAYFVGIDYAPFERGGLSRSDPVGYRMIRQLWNAD